MRILLIATEGERTGALAMALREQAYDVDQAYKGSTGKQLLETADYEMAIIENKLPDMEGTELCRDISSEGSEASLLLLSSPNQCTVLDGFAAGIDDYIPQPADCREILARVKALAKRGRCGAQVSLLKAGDISMDLDTKEVNKAGRAVGVTASEFRLLEFMIRNKNKVLSREEIALGVWGQAIDERVRKLKVHMKKLRGKLVDAEAGGCHIYTVSGKGYIMMEKA